MNPFCGVKHCEFRPKTSNYINDGKGRDSYISIDNGGLAKVDKPVWNRIVCAQIISTKPYV